MGKILNAIYKHLKKHPQVKIWHETPINATIDVTTGICMKRFIVIPREPITDLNEVAKFRRIFSQLLPSDLPADSRTAIEVDEPKTSPGILNCGVLMVSEEIGFLDIGLHLHSGEKAHLPDSAVRHAVRRQIHIHLYPGEGSARIGVGSAYDPLVSESALRT